MAINFGVGQCVDIFMRAGEMSCSMPLENDRWVLATIALAKADQILVHVSGGVARWLPRQSDALAAPGVHTGYGLARAASHVEVFSHLSANNQILVVYQLKRRTPRYSRPTQFLSHFIRTCQWWMLPNNPSQQIILSLACTMCWPHPSSSRRARQLKMCTREKSAKNHRRNEAASPPVAAKMGGDYCVNIQCTISTT